MLGGRVERAMRRALALAILATTVIAPSSNDARGQMGGVYVENPFAASVHHVGETIPVVGRVFAENGDPIPQIDVTVVLLDPDGDEVPGTEDSALTGEDGRFFMNVTLPESMVQGAHRLHVETANPEIESADVMIHVTSPNPPPGTLPSWVWAVGVLVAGVAAGIGLAIALWIPRARTPRPPAT